ncbi:MAG TPA: sulfur carrier protein ThiS, partial [Pedomonas sp.]|nr:sulfur carrier protein ThiS [Pedomonas sp.]
MIQIQLNGEPKRLNSPVSISGLLTELGLTSGKVAVERNLEIVPKSAYDTTQVADGDKLEIVHFVGGGDLGPL